MKTKDLGTVTGQSEAEQRLNDYLRQAQGGKQSNLLHVEQAKHTSMNWLGEIVAALQAGTITLAELATMVPQPETHAMASQANAQSGKLGRLGILKGVQEVMQRGAGDYGSYEHGHKNLGLEWTGLIQNHYGIDLPHPIPASLVSAMFVASKVNRGVCPGFRPDDWVDSSAYSALGGECKELEVEG